MGVWKEGGLKGGGNSLSRTVPKRAPPQELSVVRGLWPECLALAE